MSVEHQELQQCAEVIISKVLPKFQTPMDSYIAFEAKTGLTVDTPGVRTQEDSQVMEDVTMSKDPTEEGNTKFEAWLATVENFGAQTAAGCRVKSSMQESAAKLANLPEYEKSLRQA